MIETPDPVRAIGGIVRFLIRRLEPASPERCSGIVEAEGGGSSATMMERLNTAFLSVLAEEPDVGHAPPHSWSAEEAAAARFYRDGLRRIRAELVERCRENRALATTIARASATLAMETVDEAAATEAIWSALFPEGVGIRGREAERTAHLRARRTVTIRTLNPRPITNPAAEILFTSNVLLTTPLAASALSAFPADFRERVAEAARAPQQFWYDHPIPIGVDAESNEIVYGLRHLNDAVAIERHRTPANRTPVCCVLSVSVTHAGLHGLGRPYLEQVLAAGPPLDHLRVVAFTEADCGSLVDRVLEPALRRWRPGENPASLREVFGVDGRYGRHYSFLKAIAALWHVLVDQEVRATFKIDLDQVFPQAELVAESGRSAFGHFETPLWGAVGEDADGRPVDLGMIAGALVNQRDIHAGLFTPDVAFPRGAIAPDECVFFSRLPQALSTEAEMMTRYASGAGPDGRRTCLERIHVTGGTNGILVDRLRRFRPFTPSFVGRAEDQAYVLSVLGTGERLGYLHASGFFMRHDKEGFAREAMALAKAGKEVGDYLRILVFSAYARALGPGLGGIKAVVDPFTGCFISTLPVTVVLLRFALRTASLFAAGKREEALEFVRTGVPQLREGLELTDGHPSALGLALERERSGWHLYYDVLTELERALGAGEPWAEALRDEARQIIGLCRVAGTA